MAKVPNPLERYALLLWREMGRHRSNLILSAIAVISILLFALDIITPANWAIWLLYIFPMVLSYWLPNENIYLIIPLFLTALIVGGFYFDPKTIMNHPSQLAAEFFNRGLGIVIIWVTEVIIRLRKLIDQRLQQSIRDLNTSNRELEQFAYVASHDLREPLRTVGSFSELLARRCRDSVGEDGQKYIGHILNGVDHMQKLIEGLLEIARVGRTRASLKWVDSNVLVGNVVKGLGRLIGESGADIQCGALPDVYGQEDMLFQLFHNLIHNAIKYHGTEPPRVWIRASHSRSSWMFSVRDNGIGIAPEYHERIFLIFQRLHSQKTYEGAGIGLAICKKIVERHGGRIWVASDPGQGTTFYFTLRGDGGGANEQRS